jgi:hypothetical protein
MCTYYYIFYYVYIILKVIIQMLAWFVILSLNCFIIVLYISCVFTNCLYLFDNVYII